MTVTPEMIAAAWAEWKPRNPRRLGPGPGFVEAVQAAIAVSPAQKRINELELFLGEVQGVCMGVTMSGSDHPNPDGALMDVFRKAQSLLFPKEPTT